MTRSSYLVIVDALGRSCGITSPGATLVRHIPGCVASEAGSEPQIVELPNAAPGMYRTIIAAIEPGGPFTLTATGLDDRGAVSFDLALPGVGQPGAVFASALDVRTGPDGRLSASALGALVTLQGPPQPTESPSPSPIPTPTESPNVVPTLALPALPVAITSTPAPTAAPTAASTPNPIPTQGCTPSAGQPNKCTSSGP